MSAGASYSNRLFVCNPLSTSMIMHRTGQRKKCPSNYCKRVIFSMTGNYEQQEKLSQSFTFTYKKQRCSVVKVNVWPKRKMLLPPNDEEPQALWLLWFPSSAFLLWNTHSPIWPLPICMIDSTHLSGLPGTCRRRRHLLAHWICSSLMRMSLCRARHQSWATVVFRFFDGEKNREKETNM